ncbi:MAG TPA: PAS domain-containing protein [Candidatus Coprenecus stercoripullorum]|nr:PAS domain-containing protein [Candidatus Coprenecus stercoripullorum]
MKEYLDFKKARCKDCYKCLRDCPVKAIEVKDHQARIIKERCILCGRCTVVCPQNAKIVHSEKDVVEDLLLSGAEVVASVAPSFVSSFHIGSFAAMEKVLYKIGFSFAEETSVGANVVTKEYARLMSTGKYSNFITSACPALCRLIQEYHPDALKYLAQVDSPMVAHAKIIKAEHPQAKIVFIGPCIAKKREAYESGLVDGVLTFEDLRALMVERGLVFDEADSWGGTPSCRTGYANKSKAYPIRRGIIHSFERRPAGYEYFAVDGPERCVTVLENIDKVQGVFFEMNMCENACVGGPCSMVDEGGAVKAAFDVRTYVRKECESMPPERDDLQLPDVNIAKAYPKIGGTGSMPTEEQIIEILRKTGKTRPEDELDCGACGYRSCREKAWAVFNGYAGIEICLPFMRERAESMSYEIIHNSPEGIVVIDRDMNIVDINAKAKELLGITAVSLKGMPAVDFFNPSEFLIAYSEGKPLVHKRIYVMETKKHIDLSISILKNNDILFGIMKDVTDQVCYNERLSKMKMETLVTTDEMIKKQMRVAQEIASLLGETTAETKVALLKLKKTLQQEEDK